MGVKVSDTQLDNADYCFYLYPGIRGIQVWDQSESSTKKVRTFKGMDVMTSREIKKSIGHNLGAA